MSASDRIRRGRRQTTGSRPRAKGGKDQARSDGRHLATGATVSQTARLVAAARAARINAIAPYSGFLVGAALELVDGTIVTGCNVENATLGLTMCAERVALLKAVSEGHQDILRIAIVADGDMPTPPCGPCRQLLWELAGDLEIIIANLREELGRCRLAELFPMPFDARRLREG